MFPSFFLFLLAAFFRLSLSSLRLLFNILKPKIWPPDEVFGSHHPRKESGKVRNQEKGALAKVERREKTPPPPSLSKKRACFTKGQFRAD